jgi:hypothetical protein
MKYKLANGHTVELEIEESPYNPREDDNMTVIVSFHRRYSLNDKHDYKQTDYNNWGELAKAIVRKEKPAIIKPLYMYEHSGITIKTSPYDCPWDSGQIGFVFITSAKARKEYNWKKITKNRVTFLDKMLETEIDIFRKYFENDIWYFNEYDENGNECNSCGNFYGNDINENGMVSYFSAKVVE